MINPVEKIGEEKVTHILQTKQMEMLKELKRIFEKYHLPFFLACGTALGCVRHNGFIPWDDDVDIYVLGSDYQKIKSVFNKEEETFLSFQDHTTNAGYPYWFPKIVLKDTVLVEQSLGSADYTCGVYIDVFPLFMITDNVLLRRVKEKIRYYRYAAIRAYYNDKFTSGYKRIIKFLVRLFIRPDIEQELLIKTYEHLSKGGSYYIDPGVFEKKALIKADAFKDTVYMMFEDELMPMPAGYHEYLTDYYGDYMLMPPEDQRISNHHIGKLEIPGVKELED